MRRTTVRLVLGMVAALLAVLGATAPASMADPGDSPTALSASAAVSASYGVVVTGKVTQGGGGVKNVAVRASIAGQPMASGNTDSSGTYRLTFTLPAALRSGAQTLEVRFDGRGKLGASSASVTIAPPAPPPAATPAATNAGVPAQLPGVTPNPNPNPASPAATVAATTAAPPALTAVTVTAAVDRADAAPGALLQLSGTVVTASGELVDSAQVDVLLDGALQSDSTTFTGATGTFSTFVQLPEDQPAGAPVLSVISRGSDTMAEGRIDIPLVVAAVESESPSPTASQTATATSAATSSTTDTASSTASATADTDGSGTTPATPPGPSPWSWFLVGLVAVGGTALIVAAVLVFRGWRPARTPDDEDSLDLLSDPDSDGLQDPILPEDGAFFLDDVGEEIGDGGTTEDADHTREVAEPVDLPDDPAPTRADPRPDELAFGEPGSGEPGSVPDGSGAGEDPVDEPPARPRRGIE